MFVMHSPYYIHTPVCLSVWKYLLIVSVSEIMYYAIVIGQDIR